MMSLINTGSYTIDEVQFIGAATKSTCNISPEVDKLMKC